MALAAVYCLSRNDAQSNKGSEINYFDQYNQEPNLRTNSTCKMLYIPKADIHFEMLINIQFWKASEKSKCLNPKIKDLKIKGQNSYK